MGKWVKDSFKHILLENCQAYLDSNNLGKHKGRSQLINDVADKIREAAPGSDLPNNLNKSVGIWFGNEAKRVLGVAGEPVAKAQTNGRKDKPGKKWNKRLVARELYSERFHEIYRDHIQEYTGDGQANLRTFASALTVLMGELSEEELQECQDTADFWNKAPVPKKIQQKATKRLPTLARKFLSTAQREMGITVFMIASYRNAEGAGSISVFETEGSTFTEEKPNWKEGPRNFLDMWKDWAEDYDNGGDEDDNDEEAEKGEDALVLARRENDKYPLLPLINSNTPLDILKRILRVYVREVRKFQCLSGRIPWTAIMADNSAHLYIKSRRTKHILGDPSRMGQEAVLGFLTHWRKRQEESKVWPLKFLKPDRLPIPEHPKLEGLRTNDSAGDDEGQVDGGKGEKAVDDEEKAEEDKNQESQGGAEDKGKGKDITNVPGAPAQVATPLRKLFLKSLSTEVAYQKLIRLLDTANPDVEVEAVGRPGPAWGHWGYTKDFLPAAFHNRKGPGSFPSVLTWVKGKPLAKFEGQAPGYCRVEKTLLVLGLAIRELHRVLFTDEDDSLDFPDYVQNSPFTISDWTKVIEGCEALLHDVGADSIPPPESTNGADPNTGHSETSGSKLTPEGVQDIHKPVGINGGTEKKKSARDSAGLAGIPPVFSAIREDLGLLHPDWEWLGPDFQAFARKWLAAESTLAKASRSVISLTELEDTDLPPILKLWGVAQINKASFDSDMVTEEFGREMLGWWDALEMNGNGEAAADHILSLPWCRNGKAGIVLLVLGMRWWAVQSGGGQEWVRVLKEMTTMLELIAAAPSLIRNTRSKGGNQGGTVPIASPARATRSRVVNQQPAIVDPHQARRKRGRGGEESGNVAKKARK